MSPLTRNYLLAFLLLMLIQPSHSAAAEGTVLDSFEDLAGWSASAATGVQVELAHDDQGQPGMAMRVDFDFRGGSGFLIVRKTFSLPLPENYAFSFMLRGEAPVNTLEFKVLDATDKNIWWNIRRDFDFPKDWQRITIKKRHLQFAWGPSGGPFPGEARTLEFAISSSAGGKGSVWIDDLRFEEREPAGPYTLTPKVSASTGLGGHEPERVLDTESPVGWRSGALAEDQWLMLDFLKIREYGGLAIDWDGDDYATAYQVQTSDDAQNWTTVYTVSAGTGKRDYIYMPDTESRYLKLLLQKSSRNRGYGIRALSVKPYEFSATLQQFFTAIARDAPRGLYPKYFHGEQTYWTLVGVDGDTAEGLLNEEGMLEVGKGSFSIEPFLYEDGRLFSWQSVTTAQELEGGYLPIPSVTWRGEDWLALKVTAFATGKPGASTLFARYRIENTGERTRYVNLFLALRPFQVNPPSQSLNMVGGITKIRQMTYQGRTVLVNQEKAVLALTPPDHFGAVAFDQGPLVDYLLENKVPPEQAVSDAFGHAAGALQYTLELPPGQSREVYLAIPFHGTTLPGGADVATLDAGALQQQWEAARRYWESRLNRVVIELPPAGQPLIDTLKSNLAYILINRDGPAIQPGSRSYDRSWIRDGALTSAALLGMGYTEEVRHYLEWFAGYQFPDGKIPCCIDQRGADTVVENDSHGEFIYAVMEYYRYTRDVGFLTGLWPAVVKAADYLDQLRQQRLTEEHKLQACYGLMPESISHEGYSACPVHSYWDDFFALRGLKDAAAMAVVLGDDERAQRYAALRDAFRKDLYASIEKTMAEHHIRYIPGSVELGDFDPTATTIAVAPGGEQEHLPQAALKATFDEYYTNFRKRRDGEIAWDAYTPYEIRVVNSFVYLGQRAAALETLRFFLQDRRPAAWNHWAEVVGRDPKTLRFIGDMPHTWVGSDYIRAVRSLFIYEREEDQALVLGAGLPCEWVDSGVTVKRLPTPHGTLNYTLRGEGQGRLRLRLSGDLRLPPGKIVVRPPLLQPLQAVTVNGKAVDTFDADSATIGEFPADVVLHSQAVQLCGGG